MPTTSKKTILVAQVLEKREGKIAAVQYARKKFRWDLFGYANGHYRAR
jgi:hypothetical protein